MKQMTYKKIKVQYPDDMTEEEARDLTDMEREDWWLNLDHKALGYLTITVDDEGIVVHGKEAEKIERVRRITGYCSVTTKWNDAKKAELKDRVKHC